MVVKGTFALAEQMNLIPRIYLVVRSPSNSNFGSLIAVFGLLGHQAHTTWYMYIHAGETLMHIK